MKSKVGTSAITPFKQKDLNDLLKNQIGKAYGVYKKYKKVNWYNSVKIQNCFIDCSAGDMMPGKKTSPSIFLTELQKFPDFPSFLYLIEKDRNTYKNLLYNFYKIRSQDLELFIQHPRYPIPQTQNMDMRDFLKKFPDNINLIGLLYFDPNGFKIEDYDAISSFLEKNHKMDVILNINVSQIKRLRPITKVNGFDKYKDVYLSGILKNLHKENIWIRNNVRIGVRSKFDFIMVFGTNHNKFDIGHNSYHFVPLYSDEGQGIIRKYNYTKNEINQFKGNQITKTVQCHF